MISVAPVPSPKPGPPRRIRFERALTIALQVLATIAMVVTCVSVARTPSAAADEDCPANVGYQPECQYRPFYTPPDPLPAGAPGDIIRTEPSRLALDPAGHGKYSGTGTRIMYQSLNGRGQPVAVTGTYFEPDNPWPGSGPRPLIAFAPWAQGLGDQCATSRLVSEGTIHYGGYLDFNFYFEVGFIATMLDRGFAVVATDYQGTGTYGPPTGGIRIPTAHAVIDSARAAKRLPGTSLDPHGPVAFWGYGPGGAAAGGAVEMAPSYAPELKVVGGWVGAPTDPVEGPNYRRRVHGGRNDGLFAQLLHRCQPGNRAERHGLADPPRRRPRPEDSICLHRRSHPEIPVASPAAVLQPRLPSDIRVRAHQIRFGCRKAGLLETHSARANQREPVRPAVSLGRGKAIGRRLVRSGRRRGVVDATCNPHSSTSRGPTA